MEGSRKDSRSVGGKIPVLIVGAAFVAAAASQVKLQLVERGSTIEAARALKRFTHSGRDAARRGSILTADGKPLAVDESAYALNVQFPEIPKSEAFFMALAQATGIPASEFETVAAELKDETDPKKAQRTWRQPMTDAQSAAVERVKAQWHADGVSVVPLGRRQYPLADATSCFVGVWREGHPVLGLEASKEKLLTGVDGVQVGFTDKQGAFLPTRITEVQQSRRDGTNLTLTIDSELQIEAAQAIREAVQVNQADNGVALMLDPRTGDLLAMANWPSFRPYAEDGSETSLTGNLGYNPCYMAQLEPGSTFKILTLAKGLDSGRVTMHDIVHCSGEYHPTPRTRVRCDNHHGNRAHGDVDPLHAIAKSCNVSAATWALKIGRDPFLDYIRKLGLLSRPDLGVPSLAHGNFNYDEPSKILQLATVGFGQSITCTPVTLVSAFSMIANGGDRVEPRLIKKIGDHEVPVSAPSHVVSHQTAAEVMNCMEAVMETDAGTGHELRIPGYRLAGKTGTAQKVGKGQKGYVSNFVGFVPAQAPRAVILVMVNNPKAGKYYGASVAGPVFRRLAQAVIRRYQIPPSGPSGSEITLQAGHLSTHPARLKAVREAA